MKLKLNYGKQGFNLDLPDDLDIDVITKFPMPVLEDSQEALKKALENPVGSLSLEQEAASCKTACILICDITRPVPNGLILPELIKPLLKLGLKARNITVLVATGLHRPNLDDELKDLVANDWVLETVNVANHYARKDEDHIDLGLTKRKTPIKLDRRFVEADLKIVTGLVEPHFMAGYSGGRKVIVPGISHSDTITTIHTASFLEDPKACNCVLENNPLHEEQLEIVKTLGKVLCVNSVIDEHRRPCFFNFGDIFESHNKAMEFIKAYAEIPLKKQYRTVVTTSAGYPLDSTYYQTVKGMVGAMDAMALDSRMFIASSCVEGLGSDEYAEAQSKLVELGPKGFLTSIEKKQRASIDEWQTEEQVKAMRKGAIKLYSDGLKKEEQALLGIELIKDLRTEILNWVKKTGDKSVVVIPEGPYVIPRISDE